MRWYRVLFAIAAVVYLLAAARFIYVQRGDPAHADVALSGGIPGTLYLPNAGEPFFKISPPAHDRRAPAILLVHGYSADRNSMSTLARRLANAGYAVLAIDVRGHGANRNPLPIADDDLMQPDLRTAAEYLRSSPYVDGSKIVVMGHSMGAGLALQYAANDDSLRGAVMISGGFRLLGPARPRNALFIFAQRDPEFIQDTSIAIAALLAGVDRIDLGKTYGDLGSGTAVRALRVPDVDHISIISSPEAAESIIQWLDAIFDVHRGEPLNLADPRRTAAGVMLLAFMVLLFAAGRATGRLAPARERVLEGGWIGLVWIALALIIAMPLVAAAPPAFFVSLQAADVQASWFGLAGGGIIVAMAWRGRVDWQRFRDGGLATLFAALVGFAAVYAMLVPLGPLVHRLDPTPERALATVVAGALYLPFFLAFELLLRRGGTLLSTVRCSIARVMVVLLMAIGVQIQVLPFVVMLMIPIVVIQFVWFEIFAGIGVRGVREPAGDRAGRVHLVRVAGRGDHADHVHVLSAPFRFDRLRRRRIMIISVPLRRRSWRRLRRYSTRFGRITWCWSVRANRRCCSSIFT
jgi:dienelactone hydrolase